MGDGKTLLGSSKLDLAMKKWKTRKLNVFILIQLYMRQISCQCLAGASREGFIKANFIAK